MNHLSLLSGFFPKFEVAGLEIVTDTVEFATRKTREGANLRLGFALTDTN